jgi:hypothetical protein
MEIQRHSDFTKSQSKELKLFLPTLFILRLNDESRETLIKIRLTTKMKLIDAIMQLYLKFRK